MAESLLMRCLQARNQRNEKSAMFKYFRVLHSSFSKFCNIIVFRGSTRRCRDRTLSESKRSMKLDIMCYLSTLLSWYSMKKNMSKRYAVSAKGSISWANFSTTEKRRVINYTFRVSWAPIDIFRNKLKTLLPKRRRFWSSESMFNWRNRSFSPKSSSSTSFCSMRVCCGLEKSAGMAVQISVRSEMATEFYSSIFSWSLRVLFVTTS